MLSTRIIRFRRSLNRSRISTIRSRRNHRIINRILNMIRIMVSNMFIVISSTDIISRVVLHICIKWCQYVY